MITESEYEKLIDDIKNRKTFCLKKEIDKNIIEFENSEAACDFDCDAKKGSYIILENFRNNHACTGRAYTIKEFLEKYSSFGEFAEYINAQFKSIGAPKFKDIQAEYQIILF